MRNFKDAMKRQFRNSLGSLITLVSVSSVFCSPESAHADALCYDTASKAASRKNVVKLFKGECPAGFNTFSAEALGITKIFSKGVEGLPGQQGAPGPSGAVGVQGEIGAQGIAGLPGEKGQTGQQGESGENGAPGDIGASGETGPNGPVGPQGMKGQQGEPGSKGITGESGGAGLSASDLFSFSGSSGSSFLGSKGNLQIYPLNQNGGPTTDYTNVTDLMIPVGSSCSKISFAVMIDTEPGAGNSWSFFLLRGNYESVPIKVPLCAMTAAAKACNFSAALSVPLTPETSIALLADKLMTAPPDTKARWTIRCTAP